MRTFLALILAVAATPALARAEGGPPLDRIQSPYFFVDGGKPGVGRKERSAARRAAAERLFDGSSEYYAG